MSTVLAPVSFSELDERLHEDRSGFVDLHKEAIHREVRKTDHKIKESKPYKLIFVPDNIPVRDPDMARTRIDIEDPSCDNAAELLEMLLRREAIQHRLNVETETMPWEVYRNGASEWILVLVATFTLL